MVDIGKWRTTKSTWGCGTFPPFKDPGRELTASKFSRGKEVSRELFCVKVLQFCSTAYSMDIISDHVRANFTQLV